MLITRKIRRVGNSLMVPLPPETLRESGMQEGMEVSISSSPGRVEIEPVDAAPCDLVEFAARFTDRYRAALAELAER
jgi:antitoxin component of MazEF toxin-antitoxin module